jgi:hypothetical protein
VIGDARNSLFERPGVEKAAIWLAMRTSFSLVLVMWSSSCGMLGNSQDHPTGWVKISKSSPRTSATSVMPDSSAVRLASAVGAETAMMKAAPIAAVFCTISTDTRDVDAGFGQSAGPLVQRVVATDILARHDNAHAGDIKVGGMHRAPLGM